MKLLLFSLAGFAAGVVVSWAYIASLKATLKIYRTYIENRLQRGGLPNAEISGPISLKEEEAS